MNTLWYKATGDNGKALYGVGSWHLPTDTEPGEWMEPVTGDLVECENGYHFHDSSKVHIIFGTEFYLAEPAGQQIVEDGVCLAREGRLLKKLNWNKDVATQLVRDVILYMERIYGIRYMEKNYYGLRDQSVYGYPAQFRNTASDNWHFALDEFTFNTTFYWSPSETRKANRDWMRQRLLMYIHGGVA